MKKILFLMLISLSIYGCKSTYESSVSGIDNTAMIKVLRSNKSLNDYDKPLLLLVDSQEYEIEKVYPEKRGLKAPLYPVKPGAHMVTIKQNGKEIYHKKLFLDNRETRVITLR